MSLPTKIPGVNPGVVIGSYGTVTAADLSARIQQTRADHGDVLQKYHEVWYNAGHTWVFCEFMGIGLMKSPNDLWVYQELIWKHRPRTIIETGTYRGGSALFFACMMEFARVDGHIYTVDFEDRVSCAHPRITFLGADSTDPTLVVELAKIVEDRGGPLMVILDADHTYEHVTKELNLYAPLTKPGDWIVVEDTNVSWGPDRGAGGALHDYLLAHPGEFNQDVLCERFLLTMHPGGWLQRANPHVAV